MKKRVRVSVLCLGVMIAGVIFAIKFYPPLEIGVLGLTGDYKSAVVDVGNKGFREVNILDVTVNNGEKPMKTKLQVSNAVQGLDITDDDTNEESKPYGFTDLDKEAIKTGSSITSTLEKLNNGTATKNDEIYGVTVFHNEVVEKVHIKYSYLGISFNETVELTNLIN